MHFNLIVSFEQIIHSPQESHRLVFVINVCVHTRVCWRISMYTDLSHAHLSGWSFGGGHWGGWKRWVRSFAERSLWQVLCKALYRDCLLYYLTTLRHSYSCFFLFQKPRNRGQGKLNNSSKRTQLVNRKPEIRTWSLSKHCYIDWQ